MRPRFLLVSLALSLLGLFLAAGTARAHHKGDYLAQDPGSQSNHPACSNNCLAGLENSTYYFWTTNFAATWSVFYPMDITGNTTAVVNNWQAVIPKLVFSKDESGYGDLRFYKDQCEGSATVACIVVAWYTYQPIENANYILRANIYFDQDYFNQFDDAQKRQAIAHEVGHFFGLHEQYIDNTTPVSCNPNSYSVMDAFEMTGHCDQLDGPSQEDVTRVNAYWSQGAVAWYQPQITGANIAWTWANGAWASTHHQFNAYYWDPGPGQWIRYVQGLEHHQGIGLHNITSQQVENPPRKMLETFTSQPEARWHVACGYPWFQAYQVYGEWTCSPIIFVPSDFVGHWELDEASGLVAPDTSGWDNDGALQNGPAWVVNGGRVGNALAFDGGDDYVEVANSPSVNMGTSDFSISMWLRPDAAAGCCRVVLSKANSYTVDYWESLGPTYLRLFFFAGDTGHYLVRTQNPFSWSGGWDHVVWVVSRSGGTTLYVNNVIVPTTESNQSNRTANIDSANALRFGTYADQGWRYYGRMDEVRLYQRALTASDVDTLYTNEPVANWRLDDGGGNIAADSSGFQNQGTLLPAWPLGPTWVTPGRVGGALSFNGTDAFVEIPSSQTVNMGSSDFSISQWLKPDSDAGCCRVVLAKANSYTIDYWESLGPTYLRLFFFGGEAHHYLVRTQNPFSWTGGWDHVVWVISRTNGATLYVNGQVVPTIEFNPGSRTANIDSPNPLRLGTYADQGWKYRGRMDEVRLYERTLSASEVNTLYTNP